METRQRTLRPLVVLTILVCLAGIATLSLVNIQKTGTKYRPLIQPLSFSVPFRDPVAMHIDNSARFQLDKDAMAEYAAILPPGGHTIHLEENSGLNPKPYTVTLFHQLKCLGIIHRLYAEKPAPQPSALDTHCMNYLRQSILCRPNLRLESVKNTVGTGTRAYEAVCRDWSMVYEEADRNYREYLMKKNASSATS